MTEKNDGQELLEKILPHKKDHSAIRKASVQQKEITLSDLQNIHVKIRPLVETELFKGGPYQGIHQLEKEQNITASIANALLNTQKNPAMICNTQAKVLFANQIFLDNFKIKINELIGYSLFESKLKWDKKNIGLVMEKTISENNTDEEHSLQISADKTLQITPCMLRDSALLFVFKTAS